MSAEIFETRRERVVLKLREKHLSAFLISTEANVRYLTGFTGDSTYLLITKEDAILISDSRYTTQIDEECGGTGLEVYIRPHTQKMHEAVGKTVKKLKLPQVAFEAGTVTVETHQTLQTELKGTELVPMSGVVEDLRQVKDAGEISEIRQAVRFAEKGFAVIRASLRPEMTELEVAHELEHAMRRFGSPGASFPPIIAVGPRGALPHAHPTGVRIGDAESVLIDWGANSMGCYKSDLTRVLVTGKFSAKLEKLYKVVLKAQLAGIAAIRPGAKCAEVDGAARKVIEDAGFGKYFGHSLGHGVGLNIHELPRLATISDTVLKPGMVVTVEPGIYIPGVHGVRIEDDVLVLKDGHEVLTSVPKNPEDAIIN